jgi:ribosome biogenesis GTPase
MVIDTPGMRELQVWGDEKGLKQVFDDIEQLALSCQFRDCNHENEPGCAVRDALEANTLSAKRFASYLKLKKEYEYLASRRTMKPSAVEKSRWKDISKAIKHIKDQDKNR